MNDNLINEKFGKFKTHLLRSGLPLEGSVTRVIHKFHLIDNGEYNYERDGKIFSIDINAMGATDFSIYYREQLIMLDLLIECKYHEEDRKWVFIYFKQPKEYSFRVNTHNVFIDFPMKKRLNDYGYFQKYNKKKYSKYYSDLYSSYFPKDIIKVHKGIEIYKDGFNPKSITETIFQLIFGLGKSIVDDTKALCESKEEEIPLDKGYLYIGGELAYFIIPIIVTTSKLYVINQEITIEEIKKAKSLNEIAKMEKAVFYEQPSHLELENFVRKSFNFKELMVSSGFFSEKDINEKINDFAHIEPRILIINYDYLEETFNSMLDEINIYFKELAKLWTRVRKRRKK